MMVLEKEVIKCNNCDAMIESEYQILDFLNKKIYLKTLCDKCKDMEDRKAKKQIEEIRIMEYKERVRTSGMYPKHLKYTFDNFVINNKNRRVVEACRDFIKYRYNMYIYGQSGIGKTHLLCAVANEILKTERVKFFRVVDLLYEIRRSAIDSSEDDFVRDLLDSNYPIFLDDFGTEKLTDFVFEKIYNFFDLVEVMERRGIIITSNYNIKEIADRINDRIASRIVGNFEVIRMEGEDRRIKK